MTLLLVVCVDLHISCSSKHWHFLWSPVENFTRNKSATDSVFPSPWLILACLLLCAPLCTCAIHNHSLPFSLCAVYKWKKSRLSAFISNIPAVAQVHFSISPRQIPHRSTKDWPVPQQLLLALGVVSFPQKPWKHSGHISQWVSLGQFHWRMRRWLKKH